jgi:Uncharacterized conserved protein
MFAHPTALRRTQLIKLSLEDTWDFFSSPKNLKAITPEYMDFTIHTPEEELVSMYPGQMITYTVRPVLGIPLKWTTEITHVDKGRCFVDEQRTGPYTMWHHQHHFTPTQEGVVMTDIIHYLLPFGPLGWMARKLFAEKQLNSIFDFRYETVEALLHQKT